MGEQKIEKSEQYAVLLHGAVCFVDNFVQRIWDFISSSKGGSLSERKGYQLIKNVFVNTWM